MMEEQDKKRREDFHKYELEKEHKRREEMKNLSEEDKKKKEAEHEEELKKLRKHEKMHEPVCNYTLSHFKVPCISRLSFMPIFFINLLCCFRNSKSHDFVYAFISSLICVGFTATICFLFCVGMHCFSKFF